MRYECESCGSRFGGSPRVCDRCGAARLRRIAQPAPATAPEPPAAGVPPPQPQPGFAERWASGCVGCLVAVLGVMLLMAWCGSYIERPEEPCLEPERVRVDEPVGRGPLRYTFARTRLLPGPALPAPRQRELLAGAEVRAEGDGDTVLLTTASGDTLGYVPASALREAPLTVPELRALTQAEREALHRLLARGTLVLTDSSLAEFGLGPVRHHPLGAPDWRRLTTLGEWRPPHPLYDTISRAIDRSPSPALYAELEQRGDSVALVLVAGERIQRYGLGVSPAPDALTGVRFSPPPGQRTWTGMPRDVFALRILQLPADSALRAAAWRMALADSAVMHLQADRCEFAHPVSAGDRERLRRVLRLYDVMEAAGET